MYPGKIEGLSLTILTDEADRRKHGGYRYLVTKSNTPWTAFRTKDGLKRYMNNRGLTLGKRSKWGRHWMPLVGTFYEDMTMDTEAFNRLRSMPDVRESYQLSNGDYTTALINGNVITYLNPNCKRDILPYRHD